MKYISPLITVEDINISKEFYQNVLHQKIKFDFGEDVVFVGDFSIHLRKHFSSLINGLPVRGGGNTFELYFEENDLEMLQAELKAADVKFVHEIKTQPWQQKVLRIYDPDENIIEIGESLEQVCIRLKSKGKTIEEIRELTSMTIEFIKESIKNG